MTDMAHRFGSDRATGLTLPERCLVMALAGWLQHTALPRLQRSPSGRFDTAGHARQEAVCAALGALGLLHRGERNGIWAQAGDLADLQARVDAQPGVPAAVLAQLIQAYIAYAAGDLQVLPTTRAGFAPPKDQAVPCQALLRCGYLRRTDEGRLRWTDLIAPHMQEAVLWDRAGRCLTDLWTAQDEAEAKLFLQRLPSGLRNQLRVAVLEKGGLAGIDLLKHHWTGGAWTEIGQKNGASLTDAGFRVSVFTAAVRLLQEGRA